MPNSRPPGQVEQGRVGIGAEFGDDERHLVDHQSADEVDVARQAIELGDEDGAPRAPRSGHRRGEDRAAIERIGVPAALDLGEFADQLVALALGEPLDASRAAPRARARSCPAAAC
jgi:hypothetical protein